MWEGGWINSLSNVGVYKIRSQNCYEFYIGETSRNLNKRIYEHKDFKIGNANSLVSHNILINHTSDLKFCHIYLQFLSMNEAGSIAYHNDKFFFFFFFFFF